MMRGSPATNCDVAVNGLGTWLPLFYWMWVHWNLADARSPLRLQFERSRISTEIRMRNAVQQGLCVLVHSGMPDALQAMDKYGSAAGK